MEEQIRANRLAAYIAACASEGPTEEQWASIKKMALEYLNRFDDPSTPSKTREKA